jgi:hypothetical protein
MSAWSRFFFLLVAAFLTFVVTHSVARIEDKYLQTHAPFFDPLSYQCHQLQVWLESQHKSRLDLVLEELSQDTDVPDPLRTIPVILLNPTWLRDPHAHLISSGLGLFIFLYLMFYSVQRRSQNTLYALAAALFVCALPGLYDPVLGLGAFWLDLTAGFYGGAAVLCLINSDHGSKLAWLAGFAVLAGLCSLARFVSGPYLALQAGPILAVYLISRWRKTGDFVSSVIYPVLLIGSILAVLIGWYLWKETSGAINYYSTAGYGYKNVLGSAQFVIGSTVAFLSVPVTICLAITTIVQLWFGRRTRWQGLLECLWLAASVGLFLSISTAIGQATHAVQYLVPIATFACLCPVNLKQVKRGHAIVMSTIGVLLVVFALGSFREDLLVNLWRPARSAPGEMDRKTFYEKVTKVLLENYPQKVVASYFDEFDEYVYLIGVETYGRAPCLLPDRVFSVHESYLQSAYPGKTTPELVEMAWAQANEKCDICLVFNDPGMALVRSPFAYGNFLNPVCSAIAFEMAKRLQTDAHWRKLFVIPSKYLTGGVAVYANLERFPDAPLNEQSHAASN